MGKYEPWNPIKCYWFDRNPSKINSEELDKKLDIYKLKSMDEKPSSQSEIDIMKTNVIKQDIEIEKLKRDLQIAELKNKLNIMNTPKKNLVEKKTIIEEEDIIKEYESQKNNSKKRKTSNQKSNLVPIAKRTRSNCN